MFFQIIDDRPPDISIRRWRTFTRDAMSEVGNLYDQAFKMRHFEAGAAARYGYRPRTAAHIAKKAKLVARGSFQISPDANRDLIMSGLLRRAINQRHIARAFPTRVTVNMPTPNYAQMTPRRPNMPNLGAEIVAVSSDEYDQMQTVHHISIETDLNTYREPRTKVIG